MNGQQRRSAARSCRKTSPKPRPCCQIFRAQAERKTGAKQQGKLQTDCARSTREHRRICSRLPPETAKGEILFPRIRARCLPNRFVDKQNENRCWRSFWQS